MDLAPFLFLSSYKEYFNLKDGNAISHFHRKTSKPVLKRLGPMSRKARKCFCLPTGVTIIIT
jgi:hypothetical protein